MYSTTIDDTETCEFASIVFTCKVWFISAVTFCFEASLARTAEKLPLDTAEVRSDKNTDARLLVVPLNEWSLPSSLRPERGT